MSSTTETWLRISWDDLYKVLPDLIHAKRKTMALAATVPALSGIIKVTVENINSYLWKKSEAITKAMRTLTEEKRTTLEIWSPSLKMTS